MALVCVPIFPVPPKLYGGLERLVDFVARGLVARGHDVTLLAHPASTTAGKLVPYGVPPHTGWRARGLELWQVGSYLTRHRRQFDVVHGWSRLAALTPVLPVRGLAKVQTYGWYVRWAGVRLATRLSRGSLHYTACSTSVYRDRPQYGADGGVWHTVFNGVELSTYQARDTVAPDAPLVFLGRLAPYKGPHHAIAIARTTGRRLVMAGPKQTDGNGLRYFAEQIAPHVDGDRVQYVGQLDDAGKNTLLGSAAALLMPIEWDEPFGMVMTEAFACGTPVIAFPRGSVPEIVRDGVNGFICGDVAGAAAAVGRLGMLDRRAVRADCDARFGADAIVDAYEAVYRQVLA